MQHFLPATYFAKPIQKIGVESGANLVIKRILQ
jgi:hypothetical protein